MVFVYWQASRWTVYRWPLERYEGGAFLVPPISAYLAYLRWKNVRELPWYGSQWGLLVLIIAALLFLLGSWTGLHYPYAFSFIIALWGLVLWFGGWPAAKELSFPIAFLIFMMPLSSALDALAFPLSVLALWGTAGTGAALGWPITVTGTAIHVPGGWLTVGPACSGLESMLALMAVAAVTAHLSAISLGRKLLLFASSIPIAIVANILRIDLILLFTLNLGPQAARGFCHSLSGLLLFGAALVCLFEMWTFLCEYQRPAG